VVELENRNERYTTYKSQSEQVSSLGSLTALTFWAHFRQTVPHILLGLLFNLSEACVALYSKLLAFSLVSRASLIMNEEQKEE
jgi:hypothetical protein